MTLIEIILIAIALAMDAFAVSISYGCSSERLRPGNIFYIASSFGIFQGVMPVLGWLGGGIFSGRVETFAHWIAFGLLAYIGLKMMSEGIRESNDPPHCEDALNLKRLLILSIATSIDALAVGVSFSIMKKEIIVPSIIIGVITSLICIYGVIMGSGLKEHIGQKMEVAGGILLILIGLKILLF